MHNQPKGNRYEFANNAGFRDPRPISLKKPDDEFRIFLTGGSTAFGLGATGEAASLTNFYYIEHRETISHVLGENSQCHGAHSGKENPSLQYRRLGICVSAPPAQICDQTPPVQA